MRQLNGSGPVIWRLLNSRFPFLFCKHLKVNGHTIILFWNLKCLSVNAAVIEWSHGPWKRQIDTPLEVPNDIDILAGSVHRSGIHVFGRATLDRWPAS
jgi:hypothetical protein